jgi:isopenicillin-N N-acyltransferase-like protein
MSHSSAELPVPFIAVSGSPAECGAGYGAAAVDRIGANLEVYRRRFAEQAGIDTPAVRRAGAAFRTATAALHPRIAAMLDGVGEGAGVPVEDVYALNARTELLYSAAAVKMRTPKAAPDEGVDGGCTVVGVLGTHTATGHLLIGQNWDWHPDQREAMVLLSTRDERGHEVLALTEAGMLAKTGLNSAGLGVCVSMLGCDRDGLDLTVDTTKAHNARDRAPSPGVPYHVLLRAVLETDSLTWATRAVCRSPRNASINLLIGLAGDARHGDPAVGGELIDIEAVPGEVGWLHPVDGLITHANHLEVALPVRDTMMDWGGSSLFRSARARRLLADPVAARKVSEGDLIDVFRDHAGFPGAICRHVDERDAVADRSETVYSVLLDLDDRRLGLAAGPPCGHEYVWTAL